MPSGGSMRAVGLDGDLEAPRVQRVDQGGVELQQRFAAGADDVAVALAAAPSARRWRRRVPRAVANRPPPRRRRCRRNRCRRTGRSRVGAVLLAAGPEVAAGKAAEHGRAARMRALALKCKEDFLYRITHLAGSTITGPV